MSVYNAAEFLIDSVESVLNQTFSDFEFIIIDDKSTDNSLVILKSITDPRIVLIENEENQGLTRNLNNGIRLAKGNYLARMDADDISLLNRFERQIQFLDENTEIAMCGTQIMEFGNRFELSNYSLSYDKIKFELLKQNCFAHPTVMWRRLDFIKYNLFYDESFVIAQDYELWTRVVEKLKVINLNEALLKYRVHANQISTEKKLNQFNFAIQVKINQLRRIGLQINTDDYKTVECMFADGYRNYFKPFIIVNIDNLFYDFYVINQQKKFYDEKLLIDYWIQNIYGSRQYSYDLEKWKITKKLNLSRKFSISFKIRFKFFFKCLIRRNNLNKTIFLR